MTDDQLAGILQASRDFAVEMLGELGLFTPFGARCLPDGRLEFFAFPPKQEQNLIDDLYVEVRSALVESARSEEIIAGVIVANVIVPDEIASPLRQAIGLHVEAQGKVRFVYATYELSEKVEGGGHEVTLGKMIPVEVAPAIFVQ